MNTEPATSADLWTCWVKQCPTVRMIGTRSEMMEWMAELRADPLLGALLDSYTFTWLPGEHVLTSWGQEEWEQENEDYVVDPLASYGDPIEQEEEWML